MQSKNLLQKTFTIFAAVLIALSSIAFPAYGRRTVTDIQDEIDQKKGELDNVEGEISTLQLALEENQRSLDNASGRRGTAQAQVNLNKSEIELIKKQLEDLVEQKDLNILEQEERILRQNNIIAEAYLGWKQDTIMKAVLAENSQDPIKVAVYQSSLADTEQKDIEGLQTELATIENNIAGSEEQKVIFTQKIKELEVQMSEMAKQIEELDVKVQENQGDMSNYRARLGDIKMQIDELTLEQEEVQRYEASLLGEAENGGTQPLHSGDLYFTGVGREVYQGHGVGMSQFGALGAALKGWDYERILEHYYTGTTVGKYTARETIKVDGYGSIGVEDYVAGAGEVPDYSCEELDLEFDYSNIWKCWPEEAIKAQAVAFRTYGINKTQGGESICTSASCQVYKGGENKRWAAEETENMVVLYDGEPISAFYSSDNHNGWGTANNDTVWSNFSGIGTPKPYLRAVNDESIAFAYSYTSWGWRTNGYSIQDVEDMLNWSVDSTKASTSYKTFIEDIILKIGTLEKLRFERDPSNRVKRVKLIGSKGTEYMAGWLFKSAWNIWVGNEIPSGEKDFIYSLTYYMSEKD